MPSGMSYELRVIPYTPTPIRILERKIMANAFKVGDAVRWNSEAGEIHGKVTKVHEQDVDFMGKHRPASKDEPQYEVQSDKTGHFAMHHASALHRG
jgi:FKBP-type peptidyl-prolyl cis-trans isomerase 2